MPKKPLKVIPGKMPDRIEKSPSKIRVLPKDDDERLTTSEWKRRFARNLDRLIEIVGLSRKEAADATGIDYRVVRRLVSEGVSRADERSKADLQRLVTFFCLRVEAELWRADLLPILLTTDQGAAFVRRFRSQLETTLSKRLAEASEPVYDELALLRVALGQQDVAEATDTAECRKIAAILSSTKAGQFRRLIDDYFEFVMNRHEPIESKRTRA